MLIHIKTMMMMMMISHEPVCPQSSRMVGLGHVSQAAGVNMNGGFVSERSGLLLARCSRRSVTDWLLQAR